MVLKRNPRPRNWETEMNPYAKPLMVGSLLALTLCSASGQEARKETPEQLVRRQVDAYNKRDLDAFLATYSPTIKIYDFPGKETMSGLEEMRKAYGKLFAAFPDLKAESRKTIVQGETVIIQEEVTAKGNRLFLGVAIYRVKDGKIEAVWFVE